MERGTDQGAADGKEGQKKLKARNEHRAEAVLSLAQHSLQAHYFPRIARCLRMLSERQIWSRPHRTSNSVGNLALHLSGNVRQWIISGLGGAPDRRERDKEFAQRGAISRQALLGQLRGTVNEACRVLAGLSARDLARRHVIQGFHVTGLEAVQHVTEHFAYHSGQIIYIAKAKLAKDLDFTRLPTDEKKPSGKSLPAI